MIPEERDASRRVRATTQRIGLATVLVEEEVADNGDASGGAHAVAGSGEDLRCHVRRKRQSCTWPQDHSFVSGAVLRGEPSRGSLLLEQRQLPVA